MIFLYVGTEKAEKLGASLCKTVMVSPLIFTTGTGKRQSERKV